MLNTMPGVSYQMLILIIADDDNLRVPTPSKRVYHLREKTFENIYTRVAINIFRTTQISPSARLLCLFLAG